MFFCFNSVRSGCKQCGRQRLYCTSLGLCKWAVGDSGVSDQEWWRCDGGWKSRGDTSAVGILLWLHWNCQVLAVHWCWRQLCRWGESAQDSVDINYACEVSQVRTVLTSTMQMRWVKSGQCWHQLCRWGESSQDSVDINNAGEVSQVRTVLTSTMQVMWVKSGQCWHQLCRWGESSQDAVDINCTDEVSQVRTVLTSTMQMRWVKSGRCWHQLYRWGKSSQDGVDVNCADEVSQVRTVVTSTVQMRWVNSGQCWCQPCRWVSKWLGVLRPVSRYGYIRAICADEVSQLRTVLMSTMQMKWVNSGQGWCLVCR